MKLKMFFCNRVVFRVRNVLVLLAVFLLYKLDGLVDRPGDLNILADQPSDFPILVHRPGFEAARRDEGTIHNKDDDTIHLDGLELWQPRAGDVDHQQMTVQQARLVHLKRACMELKNAVQDNRYDWIRELKKSQYDVRFILKPPNLETTRANPKRKLAVCVPFKSGSETWRYLISSTLEGEEELELTKPDQIKHYAKAIQVREPLERLLSAYRFTFEQSNTLGLELKKPLLEIFSYLPSVMNKEGMAIPSFSQFIEFIVSGYREKGLKKDLFLSGASLHWVPQYLQCNPCSPQYSPHFLLKLSQDWIHETKLVLDSVGIPSNRTYFLLNSSPGGHSSNLTILQQYYAQISADQLSRLYLLYRPDFLLFNYNFEELVKQILPPNTERPQ